MKLIHEMETEVAKCDYEEVAASDFAAESIRPFRYAEPDYATLLAHTEASLVAKKLLKVEQHCYLRHGDDLPEQPWIKPRVVLEPAIESESEMREVTERLHHEYVQCARQQLPEQFVA